MIGDTINQKIAEALKSHDELLLSTLRMLSSAFNYERIAKQHDLSEEEEISVVRKEAKKRQDAILALKNAQGKKLNIQALSIEERLDKEQKELEILKAYLPTELPDEEILKFVEEVIKELGVSEMKDMGKVIGKVLQKAGGRAEGSKVAGFVRSKLQK